MTQLSIQWQIGNQCNFRCDYCHPDLYGGSNPFLEYDQFQKGFQNLNESVSSYDQIVVEFQGGEPTISTAIRNKLASSTDPRYRYVLTTNASAELDWWAQAAPNFNNVILAYHPQIDTQHFKDVVSLLSDKSVPLGVVVNAPNDIERWDKAVELYEYYKSTGIYLEFKTLFSNYQQGNDKFLDYTAEQWEYYTRINDIAVPTDTSVEVQINWVEDQLYNNYKGHLCQAGVSQIVIDYFGYVYRGWCHAHGGLGNIFDSPIKLDITPRVCPREKCKNSFDQLAAKSEKGWGFL